MLFTSRLFPSFSLFHKTFISCFRGWNSMNFETENENAEPVLRSFVIGGISKRRNQSSFQTRVWYIYICICIYILFYKRGFLIITGNEKERCWTRKGYWIRFDEDEREWKVEVERWCRALLCSVVTPDNGDATTVTASRLHCGSTHFLSTDLSPPWDKRVALSKSASTHVHFPELAT